MESGVKYTVFMLFLTVGLGIVSVSVSAAAPINFLINTYTYNLTNYINTTDLNVTPNAYFQIMSNSTKYVPCTGIYGGTDADYCTDATGAAGSGANVSTTSCAAGNHVSAINNATGVVTCSADTGSVETEPMFNGNFSLFNPFYNQTTPAVSWVQAQNYLTSFTESDPKWAGNASLVCYLAGQGSLNTNQSNYTYYVSNATERSAFTNTWNSTYDAVRANISNSTTYWAGLTAVPGEWAAVNTSAQMIAAINVSGYYDITAKECYYLNNATDRTAFLNTANTSYALISATNTSNNSLYFNGQNGNYWLNITNTSIVYKSLANVSNNSDYLDGQHGTFYLNTSTVTNVPISSNTWINTTGSANISKLYSPVHCFDQACTKNQTYNGTNIIIYG